MGAVAHDGPECRASLSFQTVRSPFQPTTSIRIERIKDASRISVLNLDPDLPLAVVAQIELPGSGVTITPAWIIEHAWWPRSLFIRLLELWSVTA